MAGLKPFLSLRDAAEYLGVEYKTVYRLVTTGQLPAGKIGGVYRIRHADLDAYFERQKAQAAQRSVLTRHGIPSGPPPARDAVLRCGRCRRLIPGPPAGTCQSPGCAAPLCAQCWFSDTRRVCRTHQISPTEQLIQAQQDLSAGVIPVLVTREQARERELNLLRRFDLKVRAISVLRDPFDDYLYRVPDWDPLHTAGDDLARVLDLAGAGYLERDLAEAMPLNRRSRYTLRRPDRASGPGGLVLEAISQTRLEAYLQPGFDTAPLDRDELQRSLDGYVAQAEQTGLAHVVGIASPTGWTAAARDLLQPRRKGRGFVHRLVLPYGIDLDQGDVFYNEHQARSADLAPLFALKLRAEEVQEVKDGITETLRAGTGSLTLAQVQEQWRVREEVARQALTELAANARFALDEIAGLGLVISPAIH